MVLIGAGVGSPDGEGLVDEGEEFGFILGTVGTFV